MEPGTHADDKELLAENYPRRRVQILSEEFRWLLIAVAALNRLTI